MPLHPEAVEFLRQVHESGGPPIHELSPVEARAMSAGLGEAIGAGPESSRPAAIHWSAAHESSTATGNRCSGATR